MTVAPVDLRAPCLVYVHFDRVLIFHSVTVYAIKWICGPPNSVLESLDYLWMVLSAYWRWFMNNLLQFRQEAYNYLGLAQLMIRYSWDTFNILWRHWWSINVLDLQLSRLMWRIYYAYLQKVVTWIYCSNLWRIILQNIIRYVIIIVVKLLYCSLVRMIIFTDKYK